MLIKGKELRTRDRFIFDKRSFSAWYLEQTFISVLFPKRFLFYQLLKFPYHLLQASVLNILSIEIILTRPNVENKFWLYIKR